MGVFAKHSLRPKGVVVDPGGPSLTNLFAWYDANDSGTIHEGDVVGRLSGFDDKSGNGHHLTQGGLSDQPYTGSRTQNGLNVIDFQSANNASVTLGSSESMPNVFMMVSKADAVPGVHFIFDSDNSLERNSISYRSGNLYGLYAGIGTIGGVLGFVPEIITIIYTANDADIYINGNLSFSGDAGDQGMQGITIGNHHNGGFALDGFIGEFFMYNALISNTNINITGNYLATKWGISWTDIV